MALTEGTCDKSEAVALEAEHTTTTLFINYQVFYMEKPAETSLKLYVVDLDFFSFMHALCLA
jgi:hypothetical protein